MYEINQFNMYVGVCVKKINHIKSDVILVILNIFISNCNLIDYSDFYFVIKLRNI